MKTSREHVLVTKIGFMLQEAAFIRAELLEMAEEKGEGPWPVVGALKAVQLILEDIFDHVADQAELDEVVN